MSRFWRINVIWRKELKDILRDRRTVIAMVLVPIALYPVLILGALQAFVVQNTGLIQERYRVAVASDEVRAWLRKQLDVDPVHRELAARRGGEQLDESAPGLPDTGEPEAGGRAGRAARADAHSAPPDYDIVVRPDVADAVRERAAHAGLVVEGQLPTADAPTSSRIEIVKDATDIRSEIAATGLMGVLERANDQFLSVRLRQQKLDPSFITPMRISSTSIATPEQVGGSILGQIVPLILILMTITGAIYPAIDLTAGERERGTLETLMVAPVPTVELIAGKFIVVTLIGMLSAVLNLVSIGGTIYLGGLGDLLARGSAVTFPLSSLPWILVLLIPLAVLFSAMLLAVCSFARSFKEAQNYVVPVLMAALIPAIVGVMPGAQLKGPMLILPVANIVILTRDLFMGHFDAIAILWVSLSTSLYAGAAVAVAAKLFGQEAVLFADTASLRTIFVRRFFKPRNAPTTAQAFLVMGLVYPANYYIQLALQRGDQSAQPLRSAFAIGFTFIALFVLVPCFAAMYARVRVPPALSLRRPPTLGLLAGLCFGLSTWILAKAWLSFQQTWMPMSPEILSEIEEKAAWIASLPPAALIFFFAFMPAVCEELFFRGYALSGLRGGLGRGGAILVVGLCFGLFHQDPFRLIVTSVLGILLALLVTRYQSIWPAMLAHFLHNGLSVASSTVFPLKRFLSDAGFSFDDSHPFAPPPTAWVFGALALTVVGVLLCLRGLHRLPGKPGVAVRLTAANPRPSPGSV